MYALIALGMVAAAIVVAAMTGFMSSSIIALVLAMAACAPAGYGFWKGTQNDTQTQSALNMLALLLAGAVSLLLLILKVITWGRTIS